MVFPYHAKYPTDDPRVIFVYAKRHNSQELGKSGFHGIRRVAPSDVEGKAIFVKFMRRYSREAHRLLAGISLTPELLYHELIKETGTHFVVMGQFEATSALC